MRTSRRARRSDQSDGGPPITALPSDLLERILTALPERDFLRLRCVSRAFRSICSDPHLGQRRVAERYGITDWHQVGRLVAAAQPPASGPRGPGEVARWAARVGCARLRMDGGQSPLHVLAGQMPRPMEYCAHERTIGQLLRQGAEPALPDAEGYSALERACLRGPDHAVRQLAAHPAPLRPEAFLTAIERGLSSAVLLLPRVPEQARSNATGCTPLHVAISARRPHLVRALIAAELPVGARCHDHWNCLELAARLRDTESLHLLVDAGADLNAVCPLGFVPVHQCVATGNLDLLRLLIEKMGAAAETPCRRVSTICLAAEFGEGAIVRYLVEEQGLPPDTHDAAGWTPLMYAAKQAPSVRKWRDAQPRYAATIETLLQLGARRRRASGQRRGFRALLREAPLPST